MNNQNKYDSDPTFLARWIANELSEEELKDFEKSEEFKDFDRINTYAQEFTPPTIDLKTALKKTQAKTKLTKPKKIVKLKPIWYAVAASVIIILGLFSLYKSTKIYTASYGEQLAINLPDGSKIQLNAGSTISHKRFFWTKNRTLELNGEAYFEVGKGEKFSVNTAYGTVSVLGTKFNVKSRTKIFEVNCFEGAVRFDQINDDSYKILYKNDKITLINNEEIIEEKTQEVTPNWMRNMTSFKERPLYEVLEEFSIQYNVTFKTQNIDLSRLFTGNFIHNNLEVALKTTLNPMDISYIISKDQKTITLE